ncbi:hypothetical protein [Micromonospora chalcea]|uniref:hypothetical protein n=1 Tax=Micromonospora chalcea TaxID=1874 RepID=UPI001C6FF41E|nr:hypothetical protein [Micromonospora chalcea]
MDFVLDPPRAAGPLRIGMSLEEAEQTLRMIDGYLPPRPGDRSNPGFAHYESELSIAVSQDRSGSVDAVEVYRPSRDVVVLFRGIPIFDLPAEGVIQRLSGMTQVEIEDGGLRVLAPDLLLSLWRSVLPEGVADEDGRCFEAALVAAPGFYD